MNVVVTTEGHFIDVDGVIFSRSIAPTFFERYLEVWEEVLLLGACRMQRHPRKVLHQFV